MMAKGNAANVKTGTIAPAALFGAGFSDGKARDKVEGNMSTGMESSRNKSSQFRRFK